MKRFTYQLAILVILLLFPVLANAESGKVCNEKGGLAWEMNTEADMDKYTVYHGTFANLQKGSVGVVGLDVPHDTGTAVDNGDGTKTVTYKLPVLPEGQRYFRISASDTSGNESPLSNEVDCDVNFSPNTPTLELRMTFQAPTPTP